MKPPEGPTATRALWCKTTRHTKPTPHWEHEVGDLSESLRPEETTLVSELLTCLRQPGGQHVLAFYPFDDALVAQVLGPSPSISKTMPRGVFFKRHTARWVGRVWSTGRSRRAARDEDASR